MLVCHCRRVNSRAITETVEAGASSVPDVAARCGAGSRCGGCWPTISELLEAVRSDQRQRGSDIMGTVA